MTPSAGPRCTSRNQLGAKFLVAFTETGRTPTVLARYRSSVPLLAFTPDPQVRNQLSLTWGVESYLVDPVTHTDHMVRQVEARLLEFDRCSIGDHVTIVAGQPTGHPRIDQRHARAPDRRRRGGAAPAYTGPARRRRRSATPADLCAPFGGRGVSRAGVRAAPRG